MNKLDYLKYAIQHKCHYKKAWIVSCFSRTRYKDISTDTYPGMLINEEWGYSFINDQNEKEKIDDVKSNEILFRFLDRITIDSTWIVNVNETIETTIGNLLFNAISIVPAFGNKYPFVKGKVSVSAIEANVAKRLKDTPMDDYGNIDTTHERSTDYYYVDEYMKFVDSLQFISSISQLVSWSATPKSIIPPDGIQQFKSELLSKYKGQLHDPVILAKFESELLAYDDRFLQGDPANGKFISGKIKNVARKKMFLDLGADNDFKNSTTVTPVINSLHEGWSTDPEEYVAMMNGLRVGSFSRGSETVKGGVSAKIMLRAANNFTIEDTDCNSRLGITRYFTRSDINKLIGRYVIDRQTTIFISNEVEALKYLDRKIILRSPMYCKLEGNRICKVCSGDKLFKFPKGLTIPLTEISSIILATSLKAMHGTVLSTAKLNINNSFT